MLFILVFLQVSFIPIIYNTCHELRLILHFLILDKHNTHFDDDAVSPPSSPTPGLKIIQGMKQT